MGQWRQKLEWGIYKLRNAKDCHQLQEGRKRVSLVNQVVKHLPSNVGNLGSIPGSRRSPGGGNGNPLQYSCLENPMDRGAWWATVHGVAKSWTRLSDFTFTFRKSQGWFLPRTFGGHKAFLTPWFWTCFQNCKRINFSDGSTRRQI